MAMCRVWVWVCVLRVCAAGRVLVVFPVADRSHAVLGDSLVKTLLEAGHEVTYVSPLTRLPPSTQLTRVLLGSLAEPVADKERLSLADEVGSPRPAQKVLEEGTVLARRALEHNATRELLADTELTFDLVVAEWYFSGLLAPLASVYSCPLVWYSAGDASWMSLQLMHGHTNSAYSVDPQSRSSAFEDGLMARARRLCRQAYLTGWVYYMMYYVEAPIYEELYKAPIRQRGRTLTDYEELVYNSSMLLINSNPLIGQILTLPPNAKYVGGHHIAVPTKPLPKNLEQLLDRSSNGVIFFSLGPNIKSKDLPERMRRKLLDLFGHLEQTVIWKFEEALTGLPRNVHILNRASQTSILKHTNTVLLITHGGFTSCMEAVYFGVPIIGIPLFDEQFLTIDLVVSRGRGLRVDLTDDLPYRLYDAIHKILGDASYHSNTQQASAIFNHILASPARELLHWMELVMHHGAAHLRSPAVQLSVFRKMHLDVLAVVVMIFWFCSKVVKVIRVHWSSDDLKDDRKKQ